ncbi:hypothetical protein B0H15DRAFT_865524 [Mycena belliarum]|uniref:Uncharacterized protein n=1 Tax=Mycena belliarum TaxID=1033014 RepID=A0AAD6XHW2_9AGAR|nr:hypothetical protein B0H15DRAFT_865524 [Mycena belliae]
MAKTRTAASGSVAPPSPRLTLRLAPVHLDELALIWPANPRIPSVESRRTWALARNILPGTVHHWFSHRRRAADKLCLKIPADTYELAVGTPPIIPVAVTDEPAEIDVSATARKPQNSLKRKLNAHVEPASDDILESERRSRTKKKKADAGASGHNAILQLSTPAPRKATTKNELKIDHVLEEAVPKNSSVKRKRNSDNADAAEPAPPTLQHKQKKKKTSLDLAPLSETTTTTRPEKKKKKFDATSGSEPGAPPSKSTKRKATIGSHAEYVPPSSSPTLVASSPPRSDAYDGPTTSPSFKPTKKSAYIHHPAVLDVPKLSRSVTSTKTNAAALNKTNTSKKSKPSLKKPTLTNSNTSPIPDASTPPQKVNTSKNKLSAPSKRKAKTKATPAPAPTLPEPEPKPESEPEPVCNQGDEAITTGFTCALCAAPTTGEIPLPYLNPLSLLRLPLQRTSMLTTTATSHAPISTTSSVSPRRRWTCQRMASRFSTRLRSQR